MYYAYLGPDHVQLTFSFLFSAKTLSIWKSIAYDPALY